MTWQQNADGTWWSTGGGFVDSQGVIQVPDSGGEAPPVSGAHPPTPQVSPVTATTGTVPTPQSSNGPGQTYQTRNGPRTTDQMTVELRNAGYGGPWDAASVAAAYARTTGGQTSGNNGLDALVNGSTQYNQQYYDIAKAKNDADIRNIDAQIADATARLGIAKSADERANTLVQLQQAQANKTIALDQAKFLQDPARFNVTNQVSDNASQRTTYANFAQNLINASSNLRGPRDWDQYLALQNNGRDVLSSMLGGQGRPSVEAAARQGDQGPMTVSDVLQRLGIDFSKFNGPVPTVGSGAGLLDKRLNANQSPQSYAPVFSQIYNEVSRARGGAAILPNDPEYVRLVVQQTGLSPDVVTQVAQRGHDYYAHNQAAIPDSTVDQLIGSLTSAGVGTQGPGQEFNSSTAPNRQIQPVGQRPLPVPGTQSGDANPTAPSSGNLHASNLVGAMSGQNGSVSAAAQAPGGGTSQSFGSTMSQAANPAQTASPTPSQGWQVNPGEWDRVSANPDVKQRAYGYLESHGQSPATWQYQMDQTRPKGNANPNPQTDYQQPVSAF